MPSDRDQALSDDSSLVSRFRAKLLEDRSKGRERRLAEYLEEFPGEDVRIATEFALLARSEESSGQWRGPIKLDRVGSYRVLREIGRGGQGRVFLAEDTRVRRQVALKIMTSHDAAPGSAALERFVREAEVAFKLDHPGICSVYEVGIDDGLPFIAMRFVPGSSLAERLAERRSRASGDTPTSEEGEGEASMLSFATSTNESDAAAAAAQAAAPDPQDYSGASASELRSSSGSERNRSSAREARAELRLEVGIVERIARALEVAHRTGVIHRDVKPSNVILREDGQPVVLDFGLARDSESDLSTLTGTGDVFGTPSYMAPEQLDQGRRADARADVWALGVMLYEALTLDRPFEGHSRERLYRAILHYDPPAPSRRNPAVSTDLDVVVRTALEKDRDRRYQSAAALADDLHAVLEDAPIRARPPSLVQKLMRYARRRPAAAALVVVLAVATPTIGGLAGFLLANRDRLETGERVEREESIEASVEEGFLTFLNPEGQQDRARAAFGRVLQADPAQPLALLGLGLLEARDGRATEFLSDQRQSLEAKEEFARLRSAMHFAAGEEEVADAIVDRLDPPQTYLEHLSEACRLYDRSLRDAQLGDRSAADAFREISIAILVADRPRAFEYVMRIDLAARLQRIEELRATVAAASLIWADNREITSLCAVKLARVGAGEAWAHTAKVIEQGWGSCGFWTLFATEAQLGGDLASAHRALERAMDPELPKSLSDWLAIAEAQQASGRRNGARQALIAAREVAKSPDEEEEVVSTAVRLRHLTFAGRTAARAAASAEDPSRWQRWQRDIAAVRRESAERSAFPSARPFGPRNRVGNTTEPALRLAQGGRAHRFRVADVAGAEASVARLMAQGQEAFAGDQLDEAEKLFGRAVAIRPAEHIEGRRLGLATVLAEQGKAEAALRQLEHGVRVSRDPVASRLELVRWLLAHGDKLPEGKGPDPAEVAKAAFRLSNNSSQPALRMLFIALNSTDREAEARAIAEGVRSIRAAKTGASIAGSYSVELGSAVGEFLRSFERDLSAFDIETFFKEAADEAKRLKKQPPEAPKTPEAPDAPK